MRSIDLLIPKFFAYSIGRRTVDREGALRSACREPRSGIRYPRVSFFPTQYSVLSTRYSLIVSVPAPLARKWPCNGVSEAGGRRLSGAVAFRSYFFYKSEI